MDTFQLVSDNVDELILKETNIDMKEITDDLEHISYIWEQLANYIYDQGITIDQINNDLETVENNVEEGTNQIEKAVMYAKDRLIIVRDISLVVGGGILGGLGFLAGPLVGAGTVLGGAAVGGAAVAKLHIK